MRLSTLPVIFCAVLATAGCRTAVVTGPNKPDTKTVISVHEEPKTQPSDKGLQVIDQR